MPKKCFDFAIWVVEAIILLPFDVLYRIDDAHLIYGLDFPILEVVVSVRPKSSCLEANFSITGIVITGIVPRHPFTCSKALKSLF